MSVGQRGSRCLSVLLVMIVMCVCAMCVRGQSGVQLGQHLCRRGKRTGPTSGWTDGPADVGVGVRR